MSFLCANCAPSGHLIYRNVFITLYLGHFKYKYEKSLEFRLLRHTLSPSGPREPGSFVFGRGSPAPAAKSFWISRKKFSWPRTPLFSHQKIRGNFPWARRLFHRQRVSCLGRGQGAVTPAPSGERARWILLIRDAREFLGLGLGLTRVCGGTNRARIGLTRANSTLDRE